MLYNLMTLTCSARVYILNRTVKGEFPGSISMDEIKVLETTNADIDGEENDDEYEEDNEEFYFESDHLALRGNADYRAVLRTIVILEAQRIEATKHIDLVTEAEKIALNDPEAFLQKLQSGECMNFPGRINIQNVCVFLASFRECF